MPIRSRGPLIAVSMVVLAVAAACGDNPNKPVNSNEPAAIALTSGDGQVGMPGSALATPVVARVTNASGKPVANTPVGFVATRGLGTVASPTVTTDANGEARTTWILGNGSVRQLLTVTAGKASGLAAARVDTTRLAYLSVGDTANVGDTIRVWTAVGLGAAPGEAWGSLVSTVGWSDATLVKAVSYTTADSRIEFFNVFGAGSRSLQTAASFPENQSTNATGGPRVYALKFVVQSAAKGKDVPFSLAVAGLIGARTFTDLQTSVGAVGATVHVR